MGTKAAEMVDGEWQEEDAMVGEMGSKVDIELTGGACLVCPRERWLGWVGQTRRSNWLG